MTIQTTTSKPLHHSGILTTTTQLSSTPGVQHALPQRTERQRPPVTFEKLWDSYPSGHPMKGKDAPDDQCTIKLSVSLHGAGIDMDSFRGQGQTRLDGKRTAMRVKEMIEWLNTKPFPEISKPVNITGEDWARKIANKTGIIAFCNYWARTDSQKKGAPTGDHIDLWNGSRITHNSLVSFGAYLGRGAGIHDLHVDGEGYSDHDKANPILFWEIK